jgi:hypothetical protein
MEGQSGSLAVKPFKINVQSIAVKGDKVNRRMEIARVATHFGSQLDLMSWRV